MTVACCGRCTNTPHNCDANQPIRHFVLSFRHHSDSQSHMLSAPSKHPCIICGKIIPPNCSSSWVRRHCLQNKAHQTQCDTKSSYKCTECQHGVIVLSELGATARTDMRLRSEGKQANCNKRKESLLCESK